MRFNAKSKTEQIRGCQTVCVVKTGDGNYRGVYAAETEDREFLEQCLESDENVIEYQV